MNKNFVSAKNCPILLAAHSRPSFVDKSIRHIPIHRNRLLAEASRVFTLLSRLSNKTDLNKERLYKILFSETKRFEEKIQWLEYGEESVLVVCYAFGNCIEEILRIYASLKARKQWQNISYEMKNKIENKEHFFSLLNKLCKNPSQFIDVIEFVYVCLNLCFGVRKRGSNEWQQTADCLYQMVQMERGEVEKRLSFLIPEVTARSSSPKTKQLFFSWIEVFLLTLLIISGMYCGTDYLFKLCSKQFSQELLSIASTVKNV